MLGAYTILSSMDRVKFFFTYKVTNEDYESNKILSNMIVSSYYTRVKGYGGHILFSPVRIGLRLCVTYKETSEGNETNQILSDMMVGNY